MGQLTSGLTLSLEGSLQSARIACSSVSGIPRMVRSRSVDTAPPGYFAGCLRLTKWRPEVPEVSEVGNLTIGSSSSAGKDPSTPAWPI